jgi:enoyl-CoA hydratase/carnithine racemase
VDTPLREERRGSALVLTVDRPRTKNALDPEVHDALAAAIDRIAADPSIRAVVLTGAGDTFLSGGDLKFIRERPPQETLPLSQKMTALLDRLEALPVPVIAAIHGAALGGGCEIAMACDYRIAEPRAQLSFRHAAMGLSTGWGAATRLGRLVPRGTAVRLLLTAEMVSGEAALAAGLVDELAPEGGALSRALELSDAVARVSPRSVAALKRVINAVYAGDHAASRAAEWAEFEVLWSAEDHREALEAFFAKRAPRWG